MLSGAGATASVCMCVEGLLSTHYHVQDFACAHFISEAREDRVSII